MFAGDGFLVIVMQGLALVILLIHWLGEQFNLKNEDWWTAEVWSILF